MLRARHEALVTQNIGLVESIALNILEGLPTTAVQFDDLYSPGQTGLLQAAKTFNPAKGVQFSSYAKFRIRGAMLDYLRSIDHASRDSRRFSSLMTRVVNDLIATGADVTDQAIAGRMGVPLERFRNTRSSLIKSVESMDAPVFVEDFETFSSDLADDNSLDPEREVVVASMKRLLARAIEQLPRRYQIAVQLYFYEELTMKEISLILGVNESRVSQIVKASLAKCRSWMSSRGIRALAQIAA